LHTVERLFPGDLLSQIDQHLPRAECAVVVYRIAGHGFRGRVPVADVQVLLVGREDDAVRAFELAGEQPQSPIPPGEDPTKGQFLPRVVKKFRQAKGWVREIQRPVGAVDEIVRAVEALALVAIRQHGESAVAFQAGYLTSPVRVEGQSSLPVERQAVGARLAVLSDIRAVIPALVPEYREHTLLGVFVDGVVIRVAEEQRVALAYPDRTFGELKSFG